MLRSIQDGGFLIIPVVDVSEYLIYVLRMSKPLDRLTLLYTFVRISERGSISAAARDLGLSQASASRQLKELEERFGTQLIRRTTHSLALTQSGRELLRDAREILSSWEALQEKHAESKLSVQGPLKVIAPVALGQLYLADIALDYQMQNPKVSLTWELDDQVIRFAELGCDCWIRIGSIPDDTLIVRELGSVERMIVANPCLLASQRYETPADVEKLPFVALTPFYGTRITLSSSDQKNVEIEPDTGVSTNNIFAVYRAVLKGVGAAVLPRWFVQRELDDGSVVDVLPRWRAAELEINAAYLPARHQPKRIETFLRALSEGVPKIPGVRSNTD